MKYLGIVVDNRFKFNENLSYASENLATLYTAYPQLVN